MQEQTTQVESLCTCTHMRYSEHVPPFGRCLVEGCECREFKDADLLDDGQSCPHGIPDGVGCMICDTDGAAEAQGYDHSSNCACRTGGECDCEDR